MVLIQFPHITHSLSRPVFTEEHTVASMAAVCLPGDTWTETLAYVMFWGAASAITATIILFNGQDFVDAPKLVHKEKMD